MGVGPSSGYVGTPRAKLVRAIETKRTNLVSSEAYIARERADLIELEAELTMLDAQASAVAENGIAHEASPDA